METFINDLINLVQDNLAVAIPAGGLVLFDAILGWVKKESIKWPGITLHIGRLVCIAFAKGFNKLADWFDSAIER